MSVVPWWLLLISLLVIVDGFSPEDDIACKVTRVVTHGTDMAEGEFFVCEESGQVTYRLVIHDDSNFARTQEHRAAKGLYIAFPKGAVKRDSFGIPTVYIGGGDSVEILSKREVEKTHAQRRQRREVKTNRQLRFAKGTASVLIVLVSARDEKPLKNAQQARYELLRASDQISDCSDYQFRLLEAGVIEVTLDLPIINYNYISMYVVCHYKVAEYFGIYKYLDPAQEIGVDHIFYHIPHYLYGQNNTERGFSMASQRGTSAFFQHEYFYADTLIHELGHNYDLNHAREALPNNPDNDIEEDPDYGDDTSLMGTSFFDELQVQPFYRCFNGANFYQLGWYRSSTEIVSLENAGEFRTISLVSFSNDNASIKGATSAIKWNDFFISFNQKIGPNSDSIEHSDKVIIVEVLPDYKTTLRAVLDKPPAESRYDYNGVTIEVCGYHQDAMDILVGNGVTCADLPEYCFSDPDTLVQLDEHTTVPCWKITSADCKIARELISGRPMWELCASQCRDESGCL